MFLLFGIDELKQFRWSVVVSKPA